MNYHIYYGTVVVESFTAVSDKAAKKYADARYKYYDSLENDVHRIISSKELP